jgi:hypothetical protein
MKKPGKGGMGPKCYAEYLREQGKEPASRKSNRSRPRKRDTTKAPTLNLFSGRYNVVDHSKQPIVQILKKVSAIEIRRQSEELTGQEFAGYIPLLEI